MIARRVCVTGRVQGVGFREWTKEAAEELEVTGWIRNRPDGSVEAHLQGAEGRLEQLVERLRLGPPFARVESVACTPAKAQPLERFDVHR